MSSSSRLRRCILVLATAHAAVAWLDLCAAAGDKSDSEFLSQEAADATASDAILGTHQAAMPLLLEPLMIEPQDADAETESADFDARARWRTRVGALLLNRSGPDDNGRFWIISNGANYRASDLNFGPSASVDVGLRYLGECADFDFRYFGVQQASAALGPITGVVSFNGLGIAIPALYMPADQTATLWSSLQSAEINLRRNVFPNVAVLAGIRYVQFREKFSSEWVYHDPQFGSGAADWIARNELLGLQVGGDFVLLTIGDRIFIDGAAKAGIYGNAASNRVPTNPSQNSYRGNAAFLGDVSLSARYRLTPRWTVRGGYQLLWLSGVATATGQFQPSWQYGTVRTLTDSDVFFHGALVGAECNW